MQIFFNKNKVGRLDVWTFGRLDVLMFFLWRMKLYLIYIL